MTKTICTFLPRVIVERLPENWISDTTVRSQYRNSSLRLGAMASMTAYGLPEGIEKAAKNWAMWEKRYADRGFKPVPVRELTTANNDSIDELLGNRLQQGEEPQLYAPAYQQLIEKRKGRLTDFQKEALGWFSGKHPTNAAYFRSGRKEAV